MERNSPINSVYVIALATLCLFSVVQSFFFALIFGIVVVATFLISLSLVSMIEKISDNHLRYMLFALICGAIVTIFNVVASFINIKEVVLASENLNLAILPCLVLGIFPIYFENTFSPKKYVKTMIAMALGQLFMLLMFGSIVEIFGYASFAGIALKITPIDAFTKSYGAFFILATLAVLFNMVRRTYIKRTKRFENLVEKYKIIIRDVAENCQREKATKTNKGGKQL